MKLSGNYLRRTVSESYKDEDYVRSWKEPKVKFNLNAKSLSLEVEKRKIATKLVFLHHSIFFSNLKIK